MNRRRRHIVDRKFQLKTAFSVIGIMTLLTTVIIIAISSSILYNNNSIQRIIKIEDQIFQALAVISSREAKDNSYRNAIGNMSSDHANNLSTTGRIIRNNMILLVSLLIFIVFQGIILYIMIIRKTHRISGPIHVMSNYFKEMISGKYPDPRPLRKKDEFIEFYELFTQMVRALKEREKKKQ